MSYILPYVDWNKAPTVAKSHSYDRKGFGMWHNTIDILPSETDGYHVSLRGFSYIGQSPYTIDCTKIDWRDTIELNPKYMTQGKVIKEITYKNKGKAEFGR
jgi:hypothetical protein